MKTRLLFLFILIGYSRLWAQDSTFVTIKTGSSIKDVLTAPDILIYPEFISGKVFFRDGTKSIAMMNYNSLADQMLFIDPKGDTLAVADEPTIKFITLDKDTFYYNEGYVRLVANIGPVKLVEKKIWELADIRKIGSHNRPATTFAVASYSSLMDRFGGKSRDLILNEDLVLRKKANYYFGDMYNHFVRAGKKNILMLFPKEHNSLTSYLKENKVNFNKKDDLEKVVQFIAQSH